jgi:hypothetical protein
MIFKYFLFGSGWYWELNSGLELARQVFYLPSHAPWTAILFELLQIAGMTGAHHHTQVIC